MKKVLLATTALVLSAGFAAAEGNVSLSGEANMGLKYNEGGLGGTSQMGKYAPSKKAAGWYEIDMDVEASIESDAGLSFGAIIELDSEYGNDNQDYSGKVYASGAFGKFTVGMVDPIADDYGMSDIGFDGIGIDDVADDNRYTGAADARWDYTVGAVTLGVSVNTVSDDYGLGAKYDAGMWNAAAYYDHADAADRDSWGLVLGGKFDAFSGHIVYSDADDLGSSWGVYGAYKTGDLTIAAAYADADDDRLKAGKFVSEAYGIGAAYSLGGGATLQGGLGVDGNENTVADFGVKFKF